MMSTSSGGHGGKQTQDGKGYLTDILSEPGLHSHVNLCSDSVPKQTCTCSFYMYVHMSCTVTIISRLCTLWPLP